MAVYLPCYASREDVKSASDMLQTADYNAHIDSAIQSATDDVNRLCHRRFYNVDTTAYWDWPNYQYALPWRIWFDERELADVTVNVPVVTSGGVVIPANQIFWGPWNYSPPYTFIELDRSTAAGFGVGDTPQRDVAITGTYGFWIQSRPAGALAANAGASDATVTVTDSSVTGVGDTITIGSERLLVSDKAYADTGQAQVGGGCSTDSAADNILQVGTGADIHAGELLQLDAEAMLATSVTGNNVSVIRSYDGTALATHTGAEVYAARQLTVLRGQFGTTAASHTAPVTATALLVPPAVRELAIAYSQVYVAQKSSAYARALAEGTSAVPGQGLPALEDRVRTAYGRKARQRVV